MVRVCVCVCSELVFITQKSIAALGDNTSYLIVLSILFLFRPNFSHLLLCQAQK